MIIAIIEVLDSNRKYFFPGGYSSLAKKYSKTPNGNPRKAIVAIRKSVNIIWNLWKGL